MAIIKYVSRYDVATKKEKVEISAVEIICNFRENIDLIHLPWNTNQGTFG